MGIKRIRCWLKAIPLWFRCGAWAPHLYKCTYEKAIIIATDKSFRVSENVWHDYGETVYEDACLMTCTCQRCGHTQYGWYESWAEYLKAET